MIDDPTLGAQRLDNAGKSPRRPWLWTAVALVTLSAPAWSDERPHPAPIALAPGIASAPGTISVAALFGDHAVVGQGELATQRGGTSFAVPIAQTNPQTTPPIILWDELKAATPAPAGTTQGTNRINIQIR